MLRNLMAAAAVLLLASPSFGAWHKASTRHFVVYANEDAAKLRNYAERLERVDQAIRAARGMADPNIGLGNRLSVFVVPGVDDVARLMRGNDNSIAGFYRASATNMIAVVPRRTDRRSQLTPESVFFHEYAHHLMFQDLSSPMPSWLVEGFAEFMSTAEVHDDGSVGLGAAPVQRARELYQRENSFPFTQMLTGGRPRDIRERSSLYARGWLLAHYLTFAPSRRGQLENYLRLMADGKTAAEAASAAFGDLRTLERETEEYLRADKFAYLTIPAGRLNPGPIAVEAMSPGAEAIMPLHMRLRAVADTNRAALVEEIAAAAARYPDDPFVQSTLGYAYIDGGNPVGAEAAADRTLAANPQSVDAMVIKGRALLSRAKASGKAEDFSTARGWFNKANRIDSEDPEPLIWFYRSFLDQRSPPTANAKAAVIYASDLAPQDMGLRLIAGRLLIEQGRYDDARRRLTPAAFNPHGGRLADEAQALLQKVPANVAAR